MRSVLVVSEWYLDGKEKIDSRLRGNDIWGGGNDKWGKCINTCEKIPSGKPYTIRILDGQ